MTSAVKIEGFKELEQALEELTKGVARGALNRALKRAAEPIAEAMRANAPGEGLKESIDTSPKLAARQKKLHRKAGKAGVELFVGPSYDLGRGGRRAHLFEFGTMERFRDNGGSTGKITARPFVRPAWDAEKNNALAILKVALWQETQKATERAAKKAAREAAKLARG